MDKLRETVRRHVAVAAAAASLPAVLSCADTLEPAQRLVGTYELLEYDGRSVPVDLGPLPSRTGGSSNCHWVVADGALSLERDRGRFALYYTRRSACDSRILSQPGETGEYEVSGRTLRFESPPGVFGGEVREDGRILVDFFDRVLAFGGPARRAPEVEGRLGLVEVVQVPTGSPEDGNARGGPDCPLTVEHGTLELFPPPDGRTEGRFDLEYALRSSCTGEIRSRSEESGTYEQVAASLELLGQDRPGVVHPFRGRIRGEEVVLFIGRDMIFRPEVPGR